MTQKQETISSADFGNVFSKYYPRFIEVAYRYVRDRHIAEDLVSDSFTALWEERERFGKDLNIPAYVLTSVKNKCLNYLQKRLRHLELDKQLNNIQLRLINADIHSLKACSPEQLIASEMTEILEQSFSRMPDLTRKIFMGSRYENKSYMDLAKEFGISYTHVNFEMRRALKILREAFKDYLHLFIPLLSVVFFN